MSSQNNHNAVQPTVHTHERLDDYNDAMRQEEIAMLETALNLPQAAEPELPDLTAFNPAEAMQRDYTLREKVAARLAPISLTQSGLSAAGRLASYFREKRDANQEKYAAHEDDSRFARARKFLGRNATRIALGAMTGLGFAAAYGLRSEHVVHQAPGLMPDQHLDVLQAADTRYIVGGHTDKTSGGLAHALNSLDGYGSKNTVPIHYPAEITPYPGDTHTLDESSKIASDQIVQKWQQSGKKPSNLIGYSEGTQAAIDAKNRIDAAGGNANLTLIAPPNGETGFFNTWYAKLTSPLLKKLGITTDTPLPKGTKVISYDTDFWTNSAKKPITTQASELIGLAGDSHAIPQNGDQITSTYTQNGVTYITHKHTTGPQTAALRVLKDRTSIPVTKNMDEFGQAIAPQGNVGQSTDINSSHVVKAGAKLIKEGLNDRGITNANPILDTVANSTPQPHIAVPTSPQHWQPTAPTNANTQLHQAVDNTTTAVKASVPKEAAPLVNNAQKAANDFIKGLPKFG